MTNRIVFTGLLSVLMLALSGCGASKKYVNEAIATSEANTSSQISQLRDKTDGNAAEISKLRSLASELSDKTDMAISEAEGFENYQIIWEGTINFDFDGYEITATAEQVLMEAGEKLEQSSGSLVEIVGHADRTGNRGYNLMLGEKRANATKRFLAERFGISLYRMFVLSQGEEKPVAMPDERNAASKNRRVTLKIWGQL
ncbi:MAG: OmpA family protein [Candidatus Zixiibacteriota bacterium]